MPEGQGYFVQNDVFRLSVSPLSHAGASADEIGSTDRWALKAKTGWLASGARAGTGESSTAGSGSAAVINALRLNLKDESVYSQCSLIATAAAHSSLSPRSRSHHHLRHKRRANPDAFTGLFSIRPDRPFPRYSSCLPSTLSCFHFSTHSVIRLTFSSTSLSPSPSL